MEQSRPDPGSIDPTPQDYDIYHSRWAKRLFWAVGSQYPTSIQVDLNQGNEREIESVEFSEGLAFDSPPRYATHGIDQEIIALIETDGDVFSIVRQRDINETFLALAKYFVKDEELGLAQFGKRDVSHAKLICRIDDGEPSVLVGRNLQPGIITNKYTSGTHFKISYLDKIITVEDQGSLNGTKVLRPANDADLIARSIEEGVSLDELRIAARQTPGVYGRLGGNPIDYAAFYPNQIAR